MWERWEEDSWAGKRLALLSYIQRASYVFFLSALSLDLVSPGAIGREVRAFQSIYASIKSD